MQLDLDFDRPQVIRPAGFMRIVLRTGEAPAQYWPSRVKASKRARRAGLRRARKALSLVKDCAPQVSRPRFSVLEIRYRPQSKRSKMKMFPAYQKAAILAAIHGRALVITDAHGPALADVWDAVTEEEFNTPSHKGKNPSDYRFFDVVEVAS